MYDEPKLAEKPRALQAALAEQGDSLDKLAGLLAQLEDRLQVVCSPAAKENGVDGSDPRVGGSPLFNQVVTHTTGIKNFQHRVATLLEELEV